MNTENDFGETAISYALENGNLDIIVLLLEYNAILPDEKLVHFDQKGHERLYQLLEKNEQKNENEDLTKTYEKSISIIKKSIERFYYDRNESFFEIMLQYSNEKLEKNKVNLFDIGDILYFVLYELGKDDEKVKMTKLIIIKKLIER